jgi:hypothetical protein
MIGLADKALRCLLAVLCRDRITVIRYLQREGGSSAARHSGLPARKCYCLKAHE